MSNGHKSRIAKKRKHRDIKYQREKSKREEVGEACNQKAGVKWRRHNCQNLQKINSKLQKFFPDRVQADGKYVKLRWRNRSVSLILFCIKGHNN